MTGTLSQALTNLDAAERQLTSLTGLPSQAQPIVASSSSSINSMVTQINSLKTTVMNFVNDVTPQLSVILKEDTLKKTPAEIKILIAPIRDKSNELKSSIDQISSDISTVSSQIFSSFGQLTTIEASLDSQASILNGQLGNAQSEEKAAEKRYYDLLALGPFGLVGLSIALGLYLKWRSSVNGYENQISDLNSQINALNSMKNACQQLGGNLQNVINKISGIHNEISFLDTDILEAISDLDTGSAPAVIELMLNAAMTQLNILGLDAS